MLSSSMSFFGNVQDPEAQVSGSMVNLVNHQWHMIRVGVSRGYDTCLVKGLVMGYADC